jgi:hypothetical protein
MLALLLACAPTTLPLNPDRSERPPLGDTDTDDTGSDDTGEPEDTDTDTALAADAAWTVLVYMVGDNDLEEYVTHDLNELEAGGPGGAVRVLVLADRAEGYDDADGDWTGTRLYEVLGDEKINEVTSPVLADWGEADMADPETLARFLAYAAEAAPAEQYALVLWNHGSGWYADGQPPPGIGWDESSEDDLSIAEGELTAGLEAFTAAHGPFDLVAFDACNMAFFEVAHALREHARTLVAAQTWVGYDGLQYTPALAALQAAPTMDSAALGDLMARDPVEISGELTFSATDLGQLDDVAAALDTMAGVALDTPASWEAMVAAHAAARGVEPGEGDGWRREYMDLRDLAAQAAAGSDPALAAAGADLVNAVNAAMIGNHKVSDFAWAGGMNIYADTMFATFYSTADGATWSQATRWDEVLLRLAVESGD